MTTDERFEKIDTFTDPRLTAKQKEFLLDARIIALTADDDFSVDWVSWDKMITRTRQKLNIYGNPRTDDNHPIPNQKMTVYAYKVGFGLVGTFPSILTTSKELGVSPPTISQSIKNANYTRNGMFFTTSPLDGEELQRRLSHEKSRKKQWQTIVALYDIETKEEVFRGLAGDAAKFAARTKSVLCNAATKGVPIAKKYLVKRVGKKFL